VLGQKIGEFFQAPDGWWVGAGIAWWPIRELKVFAQAGALFDDGGRATQARVGVGYRINFFMLAVMPYIYVQGTTMAASAGALARGSSIEGPPTIQKRAHSSLIWHMPSPRFGVQSARGSRQG
jgi:hypothetical protein